MKTNLRPAPSPKQPSHLSQSRKYSRPEFILDLPRYPIALGRQTRVLGIVNVTPDSFSDDGCMQTRKNPARYAQALIRQGADMIDVGGESSRPGSKPISAKEEIRRVIPVIQQLAKNSNICVPISIDTYKPDVARQALDAGAQIVNCIVGATPPRALLTMVKNYQAAIVLMHMRGTPKTMQTNISYQHVVKDIMAKLRKSQEICLEIGINSDRIILDPGIGFGKTVEHNMAILDHLDQFQQLNAPIMIGTSRKSFIGKILNRDIGERLYGTIATVCAAVMGGAHIVRVHDVLPVKEAVTMIDAIHFSNPPLNT